MSEDVRAFPLPVPGDVRTCCGWSCLHRQPAPGPDAAWLTHVLDHAFHTVARTVIKEAEIFRRPVSLRTCRLQLVERFWDGIPHWLGTLSHPMIGAFLNHGKRCVHQFLTATFPRLLKHEVYIGHDSRFTWKVADGRNGTLIIPGAIARTASDKATDVLRLYDWYLEPYDAAESTVES